MKNIKILISCHKPSKTLNNDIVKPIQVGAALANNRLDTPYHDNEGINISNKNKRYCELTAQYWAWKNLDSDFYGFFHYRRYLSFSKRKFFRWPLVDVKINALTEKNINKFGWDTDNMQKSIENFDLIIPQRSFCVSNYYHYKTANGHHIRDLDFCLNVIKNDYPEMYPCAKKYMRSGFAYFCNMFIMKKEIFNQYNTWLFDILQKHEDKYPCENYNTREYRVSGFLAERLCGIYISWLKKNKSLKIKTVQRVKIKNTNI